MHACGLAPLTCSVSLEQTSAGQQRQEDTALQQSVCCSIKQLLCTHLHCRHNNVDLRAATSDIQQPWTVRCTKQQHAGGSEIDRLAGKCNTCRLRSSTAPQQLATGSALTITSNHPTCRASHSSMQPGQRRPLTVVPLLICHVQASHVVAAHGWGRTQYSTTDTRPARNTSQTACQLLLTPAHTCGREAHHTSPQALSSSTQSYT